MSYSAKSGQIVPAGATNLSAIVRLMEPVSGTVGLGSVTITNWPAVWLHVPGLASGTISLSTLASATADFAAGGVYFLGGNEFRLDFTCNGAAGALVLAAKNASYELEVVKTIQVGDSASNMFGVTTIVDNGTAVRNVNLTQALGQAVTLDANNVLKVSLAAAQPLYPPAKAGDAMALTPGERTATANEVENQIIDDTDSEKVLQAITDKIAAVNPSLAGLTIGAIATGVWANVTRSLTDKAGFGIAGLSTDAVAGLNTAGENQQAHNVWTDSTAAGAASAGVAGLQSQVDELPTLEEIAARQIEDHGEGSYVNVSSGDGANVVTVTVTDSDTSDPIPFVKVRLGAFLATTDADGIATFALNNNTYTLSMTDPANAYSFTPDVVTVAANPTAIAAQMTPIGLPVPTDPTLCLVYFVAWQAGSPLPGQAFTYTPKRAPSASGAVWVDDVRNVTSGSDGGVSVELPRGSKWLLTALDSRLSLEVTIPDADTYLVPDMVF